MAWTKREIAELRRLASSNQLFYTEIADRIGKPAQLVRWKAKQLGIHSHPAGRMGQWNAKHKHLREPVLRYYLKHSAEECQKRFDLTPSEFKSILTISYRLPSLRHLRKETRTHRRFSTDDWKFIASHAGLMPRGWIAKKLGRSKDGRYHVVKERLGGAGVGSRYLNGLTHTLAHALLPDVAFISLLTKAGSPGCSGSTQARIVPWVMLEDLTRARRIHPTVRDGIRAMARFQRWVHSAQSNGQALDSITRILGGNNAKRSAKTS